MDVNVLLNFEMREADRLECEATGLSARRVMKISIDASDVVRTIEFEGKVAAIWGYSASSVMGSTAHLWLLSSAVVEEHPVSFSRETRRLVREMLELYPRLIIDVDSRHEKAQKWTRWLGFAPRVSYDVGGVVFNRMVLERKV
jgi:hypothetical protein